MTRQCLMNRVLTLVTLIIALQVRPALAALTVTQLRELSFGAFVPTSSSGTVTIADTLEATRTYTNVVLFYQGSGVDFKSAIFDVSGGIPTEICDIRLPSIDIVGSGATMALTFTSNPSRTITLDNSGAGTIYVGGTIDVSPNQLAGSYSGTFNITLDNCSIIKII